MDFNTILNRFGFDSLNFENKELSIIEFEGGYIYEAHEAKKKLSCPFCNHNFMLVHTYKWIEFKLTSTINLRELLRVKRIRYKCPKCGKTHTFPLKGIERNSNISNFVLTAIKKEFYEIQSFSTIANRYSLSVNKVIDIFDEYTKVVPRRTLPEYLCIDEKSFEGNTDGKYAVVISDFFTGEVIDVLENRQMPYLDEYFNKISFKERNNVKVFISDMYDGYYTVKRKYFPNAIFVIDLFHVIRSLTRAVNQIRIRTYNQYAPEGTIMKHFLKSKWKYFLIDQRKIFFKEFYSKKFDQYFTYGNMISKCLKLNMVFWDGYDVLQEFYRYNQHETYTDAEKFINRIIAKLNTSGDELLEKSGQTFSKWKPGIVTGLARNQTGKRFSNAIAENNNSHIQKVIDVAYGYRNFKRFRARVMLILSYKK